ncbi:WD REPEATS REGION domain-containing protein [Abeliophyllum distichum]|uniref:WD REPEATS REGION domain-containing protein n=1 Tax=Abeliophyllum distichum TaxID=126358 RepID=A0ABD1QV40_9LAMI
MDNVSDSSLAARVKVFPLPFLTSILHLAISEVGTLQMMRLISQNAIPKEVIRKENKEETTRVEDGRDLDLDAIKNMKRRRERKKKDEVLEIEQEREIKKLENVFVWLFVFSNSLAI